MPELEDRPLATNFVDPESLVAKWRMDDPLQPWWDDYDDTPGVEVWTDLRPLGARREKTRVPGAEEIERQAEENAATTAGGLATKSREGGGVEEPKLRGDWLDIAKTQVGSPYVWADSNPEGSAGGPGTGFDCSGFTAWLYSEAFGVALPHLSSAQQSSTQHVSRKNLRPGDLIFFHYSDRNGPGTTADHVEIYIGNGKSIGTPDPNGRVGVQTVDWDAFVGGGRVESVSKMTAKSPPKVKPEVKGPGKPSQFDPSLVPASMGSRPNLADVQVGLLMDSGQETGRKDRQIPKFSGDMSVQKVKQQLYRGFMDAGRPDLAKLVNTKDFAAWIGAEGGWDPYKVSQFFSGHGRNAGLFQFAIGGVNFGVRSWVQKDIQHSGGEWSYAASPYEQARMVVRYFDLTPADIKRYASQVRSGTYSGWG